MAQGKRAALITVVFLIACTDTQRPVDSGDSFVYSDEVTSWLGGLDGDPAAVTDKSDVSNVAPVSEMIGGLEERLRQTPDDVKGWRLLAQSYAYVGEMNRAQTAADRAIALGADAEVLEASLVNAHTGQAP